MNDLKKLGILDILGVSKIYRVSSLQTKKRVCTF